MYFTLNIKKSKIIPIDKCNKSGLALPQTSQFFFFNRGIWFKLLT